MDSGNTGNQSGQYYLNRNENQRRFSPSFVRVLGREAFSTNAEDLAFGRNTTYSGPLLHMIPQYEEPTSSSLRFGFHLDHNRYVIVTTAARNEVSTNAPTSSSLHFGLHSDRNPYVNGTNASENEVSTNATVKVLIVRNEETQTNAEEDSEDSSSLHFGLHSDRNQYVNGTNASENEVSTNATVKVLIVHNEVTQTNAEDNSEDESSACPDLA